jgi:hypothetical protein
MYLEQHCLESALSPTPSFNLHVTLQDETKNFYSSIVFSTFDRALTLARATSLAYKSAIA